MNSDPLLQPFTLKTLELRNRVFRRSHEPAYSEDGMPKERYRLYHVEKAKGGMALTMTAGSAVVSPDSPPAFGNLHAYKDEIVPWIRRDDRRHPRARRGGDDPDQPPRPAHRLEPGRLAAASSRRRRSASRRTAAFPKQAEDWDIDRIIGDYADAAERMQAGGMDGIEIEAYGHLLDQFWSPATNHRDDEYGGSFENRLRFGSGCCARSASGSGRTSSSASAWPSTRRDRASTRDDGLEILRRLTSEGLIDFVNVIRGHIDSDVGADRRDPDPRHAFGAASRLRRDGARPRPVSR